MLEAGHMKVQTTASQSKDHRLPLVAMTANKNGDFDPNSKG